VGTTRRPVATLLGEGIGFSPRRSPAVDSAPNSAATQPDWSQLFTLIGQRSAEAQKTILDAQVRIRETDRQIAELTRKLTTVAPAQEERTEVKVFVNAAGQLDADLTIRYQVRAASWTPFYDARLSTGTRDQAPKLQLIRRASIQQRTGESWDDVQLALSTARPGAGSAAPILNPMTVDYAPDPAPQAQPRQPMGYGGALMDRDASGRADGQINHFAKAAQEKTRENNRLEEAPAELVDEISTKVEAQSFQAIYAIAGRVAVPTTGEMKRVQIDDVALDPVLTARTVPKAEQKAYLYAKLTTARGTPLLPGTVALFRDATFVGSASCTARRAKSTSSGFGVDDLIRVRRSRRRQARRGSDLEPPRPMCATIASRSEPARRAISCACSTRSRWRRMTRSRSSCRAARRRRGAMSRTSAA
jgi:uncharacterized protein (TIGR02231 family)